MQNDRVDDQNGYVNRPYTGVNGWIMNILPVNY